MNDPRIAALAAAMAPLLPQHKEGSGGYPHQSSHRTWTVYDWMTPEALAAAILAALPPDWCGHGEEGPAVTVDWTNDVIVGLTGQIDTLRTLAATEYAAAKDEARAEIARLRKIEEAARALCDEWPWGAKHIAPPTALRAALEADR